MFYPIRGLALRAALFFSTIISVGCGQTPSLIKEVQIQTQGSGDQAVLLMSSKLDMNGFSLGSFTLPIFDPRNGAVYGSVQTQPLNNGLAEIDLSVNIGELAKLGGAGLNSALLPNGQGVPLVGNSSNVWMLNAGSFSRFYIALLPSQTVVGYALVIPQFDAISQVIPIALNFFPLIPLRSDLDVAGGIFTGVAPSTSGVALFANYKQGVIINPMNAKMRMSANSIQLQETNLSSSRKQKLGRALQKLRNQQPHLQVH